MKQIFINKEQLETRVAMVENNTLTEYEVERYDQERLVGSIFKGRIKNLENSLQAAFVDIGFQKNAFLHYWDMIPAAYNDGLFEQDAMSKDTVAAMDANIGDSFRSTIKKSMKSKDNDEQERMRQEIERIPEIFPVGSEVIVQVTKGPIGTKGPRVTTNLSIPGRYLVLLPHTSHIGVSKRIQNHKERDRLRNILRKMSLPERMGCICRTLGDGKPEEYFHNDIEMLLDIWDTMERNRQTQRAPYCLYREPDLMSRSTRYFLTDSVDEVWIDNHDAYSKFRKTIVKISDVNIDKLKHHNQHKPLFQHFGIAKQIDSIFERQVSLPSGGYICIDETEALIAIDINSGKARQGKDHPETILMTNLEAAEAIARQLRLRDIGGLVVIDFIDMRSKKDQMQVYRALKKAVQHDKAKTKISPISQLGLLEMTRQREHQSLKDSLYTPCSNCEGKGVVKSMVSVSVEIQRKLQALLKRSKDKIEVRVICHPDILHRLRDEDARILRNMEKSLGGNLSFRSDDSLHVEDFKVVNPNSMKEYR
ncbi:Rne/Rng family ribonuclease [Lentisphaera marina]|uniref:Rne/Rng family ribonuclease n=1 Tax=Lentisphaera marina TaxID=1111041 RepID=UPI0023668F96|nr:Rne/Rng family ribonuclease [Lentisphaera marina]MDD7984105.1 Rne/Rng family ribonuclease [Lentisphaera marina]